MLRRPGISQNKSMPMSLRPPWRMNVKFGSSWQRPLLILLTLTAASIASGAPVKVAETKIGEQEIVSLLTSDKLLAPILIANMAQLIWFLIKSIWDSKTKKLDKIQELVGLIPSIVSTQHAMEKRLAELPTHDQVQIKIYEAIHHRSPKP